MLLFCNPHLLSFPIGKKITDTHAREVIDPTHVENEAAIHMAVDRLNNEKAALMNWGRETIAHYILRCASNHNVGARTGSKQTLRSISSLANAWEEANKDDRQLMDWFYDAIYGQFRKPMRKYMSNDLMAAAVRFTDDSEVVKTGLSENDVTRLGLIDCIAIQYQLTHFRMPFVYKREYDAAVQQERERSGIDGVVEPLGYPLPVLKYEGYVHKALLKAWGNVVSTIFAKSSIRIKVSTDYSLW